jgi:hypothetical protein
VNEVSQEVTVHALHVFIIPTLPPTVGIEQATAVLELWLDRGVLCCWHCPHRDLQFRLLLNSAQQEENMELTLR